MQSNIQRWNGWTGSIITIYWNRSVTFRRQSLNSHILNVGRKVSLRKWPKFCHLLWRLTANPDCLNGVRESTFRINKWDQFYVLPITMCRLRGFIVTSQAWILAFALALTPSLSMADISSEKTDVIYLRNGDRLTGEVIRQEAGLLEFNTDTMGRIYIEWRFISEIISNKSHSVETVDGARWLGRLEKPAEGDHIVVNTDSGQMDFDPEDVVSIWPVEVTFWDKVDLDASLGFDYAKSTEIANFILAMDFKHTTGDRQTEASLRSNITIQSSSDGANDQHRNQLQLNHQYLLNEGRFRTLLGSLEGNDAIGVDLRTSAGGGIGKYFLKTNRQWLTLTGGLLGTHEIPTEGDTQTSLEAFGSVRYRYFRFAEPERRLDTTLSVFPSMTNWGRVRLDLRSTFKLEFFKDLYWAMELYGAYDSDPISMGAGKTDYGVVTSLGWSK